MATSAAPTQVASLTRACERRDFSRSGGSPAVSSSTEALPEPNAPGVERPAG